MIVPDEPEGLYYADRGGDERHGPRLSQSTAHTLVTQSPAHAWWYHPRLGGHRKTTTDAMTQGTLLHRLVLGCGPDIQIIDAPDFRTKAAKAARDEAIEAGRVPVIASKFESLRSRSDGIRERLRDECGITFDGAKELSIYWTEEPDAGKGVRCRGRIDHIYDTTIHDLKFVSSAHPDAVARKAFDLGYDIQAAAYTSAAEMQFPELAGRMEFVFVFVEAEPPHGIYAAPLNGEYRAIGERRWMRAVRMWRECLRSASWPNYSSKNDLASIAPPPWVMAQAEALA